MLRRLNAAGEIETVVGDAVYRGVALGPLDKAGLNSALASRSRRTRST